MPDDNALDETKSRRRIVPESDMLGNLKNGISEGAGSAAAAAPATPPAAAPQGTPEVLTPAGEEAAPAPSVVNIPKAEAPFLSKMSVGESVKIVIEGEVASTEGDSIGLNVAAYSEYSSPKEGKKPASKKTLVSALKKEAPVGA